MRTVRNALSAVHCNNPARTHNTLGLAQLTGIQPNEEPLMSHIRSNLHASAKSGRTFYLLLTLGTALYQGKGKADAAMKSLGMTSG